MIGSTTMMSLRGAPSQYCVRFFLCDQTLLGGTKLEYGPCSCPHHSLCANRLQFSQGIWALLPQSSRIVSCHQFMSWNCLRSPSPITICLAVCTRLAAYRLKRKTI